MIKPLTVLAVSLLALSACTTASPEARLRAGLIDAGLPPPVAGCMAERLVDRLSTGQLRRLQSLASFRDSRVEQMTIEEFLYKVRGLQDPELIAVTGRAGIGCAIIG